MAFQAREVEAANVDEGEESSSGSSFSEETTPLLLQSVLPNISLVFDFYVILSQLGFLYVSNVAFFNIKFVTHSALFYLALFLSKCLMSTSFDAF